MSEPMLKMKALIKAQSALTRIELRAKGTQATYLAVALVFALLGLGMLNVGAFLALSPTVGAAWSALLLGVANGLLAMLLAKVASGVTIGPAGESARELRDMVVDSLADDAEALKEKALAVQDDINRARRAYGAVASKVSGVSSVVGMLTTALKKNKKK